MREGGFIMIKHEHTESSQKNFLKLEIKQNNISKTNNLETRTEATVKGATKFLSFFKAEGSIEGSAAFDREGSTIIKRALESTILTDYIELSANKAKKYVKNSLHFLG